MKLGNSFLLAESNYEKVWSSNIYLHRSWYLGICNNSNHWAVNLIAYDDGHTHYEYAEKYHDHDYADSSHDHDASEISGIKSIIEACEVSDGSISS